MNWEFLNTGAHPGAWNMAVDQQLARAMDAGTALPTFRLYAWKPYAVSLGYHQNMGEFDRESAGRDGLQIVRRPTGGRAILHAEELTYSVVMPALPMGPREIYRWINIGLLRGLERLGIHAVLARVDDSFQSFYRTPASVPCFAASARSEIQFEGKKLIGSAQRRYGSAVLQHGSLLLGPSHRAIVEYLAPAIRSYRREMERVLSEKTIDAGSILGRAAGFEEAALAIKEGFAEALGITFSPAASSPHVSAEDEKLFMN